MKYLLMANIIIWGGILLYLLFISRRQGDLEERLHQLEGELRSHED